MREDATISSTAGSTTPDGASGSSGPDDPAPVGLEDGSVDVGTSDGEPIGAFDVCGPLPQGTCVLEASAGTGKTWTLAALTARYVAAGTELGQIMMVTFSRAATQELRTRIRQRLEASRAALEAATDGGGASSFDAAGSADLDSVDQLLTSGPAEELALRRDRLAAALSDFDSATIATTHEFCARMLDSLGVLADTDPDAALVENLDQLTREVCADEYLRRFGRTPPGADGTDRSGGSDAAVADPSAPWVSWEEALTISRAAVQAPALGLVPADDPNPAVRGRVELASAVRLEVEARKRRLRISTYDDMLSQLAATLEHPRHGTAARARLRRRYPVVLVDEFQDTDPLQWQILRQAFHHHATLILIGDPKQAVYGFRGADVRSYLQAVAESGAIHTLASNHRSDPPMVAAVQSLFEGAALGEEQIVVRPVQAALPASRLHSHSGGYPTTPLRIRVVDGAPQRVGPVRERVQTDLVHELGALIGSDAEVELGGRRRSVRPSDVAILVRANARAEELRLALAAAGVPAVVNGSRSVHATASAQAWERLLVALVEPHQRSVRTAALTPLVGWGLNELGAATDEELNELRRQLRSWSRLLETQGVAALLESLSQQRDLAARMLRRPGGERELTDLRHVAEGLHQVQSAHRLGPAALLEWLRERIASARSDSDERSRRLETDADAVQILTYHHSKGLQFPIVYLPSGWDRYLDDDQGGVLRLHDEAGERVLDVGGSRGQGRSERFARARAEESGDDLRLLYVAITRAQCQVVAWWGAASRNTPASSLHRLLQRDPSRPAPAADYPADRSPDDLTRLSSRLIAVEPARPRAVADVAPHRDEPLELGVRTFDRDLDLLWRRTSYSSLTAAAHGHPPDPHGVSSEPLSRREDDEPASTESGADPAAGADPALATVSPLQDFPGGTAFGSLVHALLEYADPSAADLAAALAELAAAELARLPSAGFDATTLATALLPALRTPLGPLAEGACLADVPATDRLSELDFEMPLAGGSSPGHHATLSDVADLLVRHLPAKDPLVGYPALLRSPLPGEEALRGFLTGSIDAVLRLPGTGSGRSATRHLVVDYKTNWLGPHDGSPLLLAHYTRGSMAQAMMAAHYPLQALLYCVALHRFLRWRQPGYDPEQHLGGVLYLFVRGMAGPQTPTSDGAPCGVFSWRPSAALVVALSELLAHGPRSAS